MIDLLKKITLQGCIPFVCDFDNHVIDLTYEIRTNF
jgi:hypothetical protein